MLTTKKPSKALALLLTVLMTLSMFSVFGVSTASAADTAPKAATALYLKPNSNWLSANARFSVYLSGGTSSATWVSMTATDDGYYNKRLDISVE